MQIGIQMYSLRGYIPKAGLEGTLRSVKEAGFDCVEPVCDDYGLGYENVGKILKKCGLSAPSMHVPYEVLTNKAQLEKLKDIFGLHTAVIPWMSKEIIQNSAKLCDMVALASENARALGLQLAYHNHAQEFENGNSPARLCKLCPDLKLQVEVFWEKAAGLNPVEFLKENAPSVWGVHMKEFGASVDSPAPVVGSGATNAKAILAFAKEQKHETITLEYEHVDVEEIEYIKKSLQFMRENLK